MLTVPWALPQRFAKNGEFGKRIASQVFDIFWKESKNKCSPMINPVLLAFRCATD